MSSFISMTFSGNIGQHGKQGVGKDGNRWAILDIAVDVYRAGECHTEWISATFYGRDAENIDKMAVVGQKITIHTRAFEIAKWLTKEGQPGAKLRCRVDYFMLGNNPLGAPAGDVEVPPF